MQTEKLASLGFGHDGRQLQGNLDKVVQHGKRADAIVKNMLLHSRQGSGEHRPVDINALVDESLNLAYHGARAGKQGFDLYFTSENTHDPSPSKCASRPTRSSATKGNHHGCGGHQGLADARAAKSIITRLNRCPSRR